MRDNSGLGKSKSELRDPTMRDHEGSKGPAQQSGGRPEDNRTDLTGNVRAKGQDPSPDDRARGEVSDKEDAAPVDIDHD